MDNDDFFERVTAEYLAEQPKGLTLEQLQDAWAIADIHAERNSAGRPIVIWPDGWDVETLS